MRRTGAGGFTLIELLVVIVVIGILASFAYASYTKAQERARAAQDMNNLRQTGLAMQTYLNDNDQVVPASGAAPSWPGTTANPGLYPKYVGLRKVYQSPFDKRNASETDTAPVSYGINQNIYDKVNRNMSAVVSASSTIFMAPIYTGNPTNPASWTATASNALSLPVGAPGETSGPQFNGRQIDVLFCDLHVEVMTFGPSTVTGTFQNTGSAQDVTDQKHWDPTIK